MRRISTPLLLLALLAALSTFGADSVAQNQPLNMQQLVRALRATQVLENALTNSPPDPGGHRNHALDLASQAEKEIRAMLPGGRPPPGMGGPPGQQPPPAAPPPGQNDQ